MEMRNPLGVKSRLDCILDICEDVKELYFSSIFGVLERFTHRAPKIVKFFFVCTFGSSEAGALEYLIIIVVTALDSALPMSDAERVMIERRERNINPNLQRFIDNE